eukprot:Colp12_sorted_trinity150504_noHs@1846
MARYVIASRGDCIGAAKAELLGERLAQNLPDFQLEVIKVLPDEWPEFLRKQNESHGWSHTESPMIWRKLGNTGAHLIGGMAEFLEMMKHYYDEEDTTTDSLLLDIASENLKLLKEKKEAERLQAISDTQAKVNVEEQAEQATA